MAGSLLRSLNLMRGRMAFGCSQLSRGLGGGSFSTFALALSRPCGGHLPPAAMPSSYALVVAAPSVRASRDVGSSYFFLLRCYTVEKEREINVQKKIEIGGGRRKSNDSREDFWMQFIVGVVLSSMAVNFLFSWREFKRSGKELVVFEKILGYEANLMMGAFVALQKLEESAESIKLDTETKKYYWHVLQSVKPKLEDALNATTEMLQLYRRMIEQRNSFKNVRTQSVMQNEEHDKLFPRLVMALSSLNEALRYENGDDIGGVHLLPPILLQQLDVRDENCADYIRMVSAISSDEDFTISWVSDGGRGLEERMMDIVKDKLKFK